jgi:hypothetical protein|tara:strand:+ start:5248 stop:5400 length:153 start_codon:yes stop_codon:yes gene_type:complete
MNEYKIILFEQVKREIKVDAKNEGEAKLEAGNLFPMCHVHEVREVKSEVS